MNFFKKNKKITKTAIIGVFIFLLFSGFVFTPKKVKGIDYAIDIPMRAMEIPVQALSTTAATIWSGISDLGSWAKDMAWEIQMLVDEHLGSQAVESALSFALNTIAYDTATWLGSGGRGQKPPFWKDDVGTYFRNLSDNAAGVFIEGLGKKWNMNLCEPDFNVKLGIGLGLIEQQRPKEPDCTWSKMKDRWAEEIERDDFSERFKSYFSSKENDLGIALELQTGIMEEQKLKSEAAVIGYLAEGRWQNTDLDGELLAIPGYGIEKIRSLFRLSEQGFNKKYDDPFVEALAIFRNQLVYTLLQRTMGNLAKEMPSSKGYDGDYGGLLDYSTSPYRGGIAGAKDRFLELAQPNFNKGGDYKILGSLSNCPSSGPIGVTDCVIDENFKNAISKNLTVREALDQGLLSRDVPFGFIQEGLEPAYNQGYPYRSMKILRKYRIIPASWEVAAEYIKEEKIGDGIVSLGYLVDCFDSSNPNDKWCKGLIDPNWVLKAPLNHCKREGFGPKIISERYITASTNDSYIPGSKDDSQTDIKKLAITRDGGYCSDDQTCIQEKEGGGCNYYGYCAADQRIWKFNIEGSSEVYVESCEPIYNTCKSFRSPEGKTVSYLTNTLNYENCDASSAGCTEYKSASGASYDLDSDYFVDWSTGASNYFNDKIETCSPRDEGCHQYLITDEEGGEKLIYQKILPDYLESGCYGSNFRYLNDAPQKCFNYGKKCDQIYAGCDVYTSTTRKFSIPAVAPADDDCSSECVGYNAFSQSETFFENNASANFIPKTARKCSAGAVGCEEFTNLDKEKMGGEAKEYYKRLKICEKPNDTCAEFYTWEGNDDQGYQLMVYSLKEDPAGGPVFSDTLYNSLTCNSEADYDPVYNPMCWEFYDKSGAKYYGFYIYTTTCSENCHPYRATNISQTNCSKGGGVWDSTYSACIYMAIPEEGEKCSASESGCRKYTGNQGNNTRVLGFYTFDKNSTEGWEGSDGATVDLSNVSLHLGGKSMLVQGGNHTAKIILGDKLRKGSAYVLSFLVRSSSGSTISSSIINGNNDSVGFQSVSANNEWSWKEEIILNNPEEGINFEVDSETALYISGNNDFYIDNIKINEISGWHYLIKNSWSDSCSPTDIGCDEYKNSKSKLRYLTGFSRLCHDSDVGCQLMTDTQNSSTAIPVDAYIVYNTKHACNPAAKACERMGKSIYYYENEDIFEDAYVINNPDKSNFRCDANQKGCQAWGSVDPNEGFLYFKDPKNKVCEYRQEGSNWDWYTTQIKRCQDSAGGFGNICLSSNDCSLGEVCIDMAVEPCPKDLYGSGGVWGDGIPKTLGIGGLGNEVAQPIGGAGGWAALCPSNQAGCTEYIDPDSQFNFNLFDDRYDNPEAKIEPYTLYLDSNNNFPVADVVLGNVLSLGSDNLKYYNSDNTSAVVTGSMGDELKKIVVDYRKRQKVDKASCAGSYNFNQGCIWFNERIFGQEGYKTVRTADSIVGVNELIKVKPDRKCAEWLACTSYSRLESGGSICLDVGLCNSLNKDGQCANILSAASTSLKYNPVIPSDSNIELSKLANLSGYAKAGYSNVYQGFMPSALYPLSAMKQVGEISDVPNGNFEFYGSDGYPVGWSESEINPKISDYKWTSGFFSVVDNPVTAQEEGVPYPIEGKSFLKFSPQIGMIESEFIDAAPNTEYTFSAYTNTENFYTNDKYVGVRNAGLSIFVHTYDGQNVITDVGGGPSREGFDFADCAGCSYGTSTPGLRRANLYYETGKKWTNETISGLVSFKFKTGPDTRKIKIKIRGVVRYGTSGNYNCYDEAGTILIPQPEYKIPENACTGTAYIDDIKIRPSLNISEKETKEINIPQTCRLYPQADSLSCEYYEPSGKMQKGYYGYCLEYDRSPGDEKACLLWWPTESVKGDGVEQSGIYTGRFPLYYTVRTASYWDEIAVNPKASPSELYLPYWPVEKGGSNFDLRPNIDGRSNNVLLNPGELNLDSLPKYMMHKENLNTVKVHCTAVSYPGSETKDQGVIQQVENWVVNFRQAGYITTTDRTTICAGSDGRDCCYIDANGLCRCTTSFGGVVNPGWDMRCFKLQFNNDDFLMGLSYDGINNHANHPHCGVRKVEVVARKIFSQTLVQVITPFGGNKRWSSRMSEGSSYEAEVNRHPQFLAMTQNANYYTDKTPFGSILPPGDSFFQLYNPSEWDSDSDQPGYQPVFYVGEKEIEQKSNQSRMGQYYKLGDLKKIFAEGYNVWDYMEGNCTGGAIGTGTCWVDSHCTSTCQKYCKPKPGTSAVGGSCNQPSDCERYWTGTCDKIDPATGLGTCLLGCNHGAVCRQDNIACQNVTDCFASCDNSWRFCSKGHCDLSLNRYTSNGQRDTDCQPCTSDAQCIGKCEGQKYEKVTGVNDYRGNFTGWTWSPDNRHCPSSGRATTSTCGISPKIENIKVNDKNNQDTEFTKTGYVKLSFNSELDPEQLPLVRYSVDWGDGNTTVVSGIKSKPKASPDDPHTLYHLYSFWDLHEKYPNGVGLPPGSSYVNGRYILKPKVQIQDNWGWCNGDNVGGNANSRGDCDQWVNFSGNVVIKK